LADSPDAILLKRRARRRLVGAIALVVLVVVILPVILDQKPRTVTQPLTVKIPSQEGEPFNTPVLPAPQPVQSLSGSATPPTTGENSGKPLVTENPKSGTSGKKSPTIANGKSANAGAGRAGRLDASPGNDAYVVPLGAFMHAENARQVREKATAAGIKSYTETVKVPQGENTRVRAGPFADREAAEKARVKLKSVGIEVGPVVQK
jgi:DedD protein